MISDQQIETELERLALQYLDDLDSNWQVRAKAVGALMDNMFLTRSEAEGVYAKWETTRDAA